MTTEEHELDLDTLDGPPELRSHAKGLERDLKAERKAREELAERVATYERREAYETAAKTAGVEGVTLEDLGALPPAEITPALLKAKAAEREEARRTQLAETAKAAGYDSVEDYLKAHEAIQAQRARETEAQRRAAAVAQGGGGGTSVVSDEDDTAWQKHKEAREAGLGRKKANAEFVKERMAQIGRSEGAILLE